MDAEEMKKLVSGAVTEARRQDREMEAAERKGREVTIPKDHKEDTIPEESFTCECGEKVKSMTKYCTGCGMELEWEE